MKKLFFLLIAALFAMSACDSLTNGFHSNQSSNSNTSHPPASTSSTSSSSSKWVTAYLASYNNYVLPSGNWGDLPTDAIDWTAFTQMDYFALNAKPNGALSTIAAYQNFSPDRLKSIVTAAHAAGKPILFTVGGWGNHTDFASDISSANRTTFINNLINVMTTWGFDGIDIDMEPINSGDVSNYTAFIKQLYNALQQHKTPLLSKPMLTCATSWQPGMFAQLQSYFNEINLMTYDYSGAWQGWVTWHNSPVYDGGVNFPGTSKKVPSIDSDVQSYTSAGVNASKLGIGIDFYGYVWSGGTGTPTGGATAPNQAWQTAPTVTSNVPYNTIMDQYYTSTNSKWDSKAQAAYISIDNSGSSNDKFISYDNEKSIQAKFQYMNNKNLGGVIIWELGAGYRSNQPAGQRDLLLQAVKQAMNNSSSGTGSTLPTTDTTPPTVSIGSPASGSTVSGTVNVQVSASDNTGVSTVQISVDGSPVGTALTVAPFTYSWNTSGLTNGSHTLTATATDLAGNSTSSSVTVTVSNSTSTSSTATISGSTANVYGDALISPWINSSWSATVNYSNTQYTYSGSDAIQVNQKAWGALSVHSGSWSNPVNADASAQNVTFSVYSPSSSLDMSVRLENAAGQTFPTVHYGTVQAGAWKTISIPMSQLNPSGQNIDRIDILEVSGSAKTYYVDDISLGGATSGTTGSTGSGGTTSTSTVTTGTSGTASHIYTDALQTPWINTSYQATVNFTSTSQTYSGTDAIQVNQNAWGALSVHKGTWGSPQNVDPNATNLVFAVYSPSAQAKIGVKLQNDAGQTFPTVQYGTVQAGAWKVITIPMSQLNPNMQNVNRINILELSGTKITYYVDDIYVQ